MACRLSLTKRIKTLALLYSDATSAARARKLDTLIIDTAGRLHNNYNLMEELAKIKAVSAKTVHEAPHEVILVLDRTTGTECATASQEIQ
ncbi:MAG UNVERIFIED_CONTAM: hypothetical protein LVT10_12840 [Anaerolineae bacterium]